MTAKISDQWREFKEDYESSLDRSAQASSGQLTNYERDYGPHGSYRRTSHQMDESTGSECLDD